MTVKGIDKVKLAVPTEDVLERVAERISIDVFLSQTRDLAHSSLIIEGKMDFPLFSMITPGT